MVKMGKCYYCLIIEVLLLFQMSLFTIFSHACYLCLQEKDVLKSVSPFNLL